MRRFAMVPWSGVLTVFLAVPGFGQTVGTSAQAQSSGQAEVKAPPVATADAQAQASAEAKLEARKSLEAIRQKGARVSADARMKAEAKLEAAAKKTDDEVRAQGETRVAGRLAAEFGMTADQLMAERQAIGCSWGELMIAHSLDANATTDVTVNQLFELRQEGTGWGQIAAGLGFKLGEAVRAVQAESQVAAGLAKPDGKVAVIRGEGARAGVGANAGAGTGAAVTGAQAGAQASVGVGVKIKP